MAPTFFENGGVAESLDQLKGVIRGLRTGDMVVVNDTLPLVARAADAKRGRPVELPRGDAVLHIDGCRLTGPQVYLETGGESELPVETITTPPLDVDTTTAYLHKAGDGAPFCSYDTELFQMEPYLHAIEGAVLNAINSRTDLPDVDGYLAQLPSEDTRDTDRDALPVATVRYTRFGVVGVDPDIPDLEAVTQYAAEVRADA